jgi:hypothetical protein
MRQSAILSTIPLALMLAESVSAACEGGYTYGYCEDRIVHWYDPDSGEICDPLNCGGGRAPVKYDVPGCAAYTGTEIYSSTRAFMPCFDMLKTAATQPDFLTTTSAGGAEPTEEPDAKTTEEPGEPETKTSEKPEESSTAEEPALPTRSPGPCRPDEFAEMCKSLSTDAAESSKAPSSGSSVSAPAATSAATLSTVTESSTTANTPPASTDSGSADPGSGAAGLKSSMLAVAAVVMALALSN